MKDSIMIVNIPDQKQATTARITFYLVIAGETAFFMTLLMAFLYMRLSTQSSAFMKLQPLDILYATVNTGIIISSVITVWSGLFAVQRSDHRQEKLWLLITLLLGIAFIAGQIFEFNHSGMRVNDPSLGGAFFALMVFHGVHVLVGLLALVITIVRVWMGDFSAVRHTAVKLTTWFWTYVALVWCVLYLALYWV